MSQRKLSELSHEIKLRWPGAAELDRVQMVTLVRNQDMLADDLLSNRIKLRDFKLGHVLSHASGAYGLVFDKSIRVRNKCLQ